jgi:hypothetical protein
LSVNMGASPAGTVIYIGTQPRLREPRATMLHR